MVDISGDVDIIYDIQDKFEIINLRSKNFKFIISYSKSEESKDS